MRIDYNVLFNDVEAEKLGTEPKEIWGNCCLDSNQVAFFGETYLDGKIRENIVEVHLKSNMTYMIQGNFDEFKKLMKDAGFGS